MHNREMNILLCLCITYCIPIMVTVNLVIEQDSSRYHLPLVLTDSFRSIEELQAFDVGMPRGYPSVHLDTPNGHLDTAWTYPVENMNRIFIFMCYCYQIWTDNGQDFILQHHLIFHSITPSHHVQILEQKNPGKGEKIQETKLISLCSNFKNSILVTLSIRLTAEVKNSEC